MGDYVDKLIYELHGSIRAYLINSAKARWDKMTEQERDKYIEDYVEKLPSGIYAQLRSMKGIPVCGIAIQLNQECLNE